MFTYRAGELKKNSKRLSQIFLESQIILNCLGGLYFYRKKLVLIWNILSLISEASRLLRRVSYLISEVLISGENTTYQKYK